MIYKFKSQAAADLLMTGPVGDRVLALIGKEPSTQGIIDVDQIPAAIRALEAAAQAESPKPADRADEQGDVKADPVSLRQRVWPMVEMLKLALAEKQPFVWGV